MTHDLDIGGLRWVSAKTIPRRNGTIVGLVNLFVPPTAVPEFYDNAPARIQLADNDLHSGRLGHLLVYPIPGVGYRKTSLGTRAFLHCD